MIKMTREEIGLLRELANGARTISGNRSRTGLKRIIEAGYVTEQAATRGDLSAVFYNITNKGRDALKAAEAS